MLLSDVDLREALNTRSLRIDPLEDELVQPASIDLRLARQFRVFANHRYSHIDPAIEQTELTQLVVVPPGEPFVLHPGEFALGCTKETVGLDYALAARIEGKSSLGRLGLLTHSTAGFVDPGFVGQLTLELANVATLPIKLWPGMRIGQLCVFGLSSAAQSPYGSREAGSRYHGQIGPTPSRSFEGWKVWS